MERHEDVPAPELEPRAAGAVDRAGQARRYAGAIAIVALVGLLIAWVVANRDTVEVEWLVGSTDAALALVIFLAAALGWVIGLITATAIRRRMRR